jgi:hypothetical protein
MQPAIKIAAGAGILYWLYRKHKTDALRQAALQSLASAQAEAQKAVTQVAPPLATSAPQVAPPLATSTPQARATSAPKASATSARPAAPKGPTLDAVSTLVDTSTVSGDAEHLPGNEQKPPKQPKPATRPVEPRKLALVKPDPNDGSEPVTDDARDVLHTPEIRTQVSEELAETLDRVAPAEIPFDKLPDDVKTLLLRGFAADYVMPKAIPEPGYAAAVAASTATGLPIGWTQMLVVRGVQPEDLTNVAVDLISTLTEVARTQAGSCGECKDGLDLRGIRGTLMGRFAPLPEGSSVAAGW